MHCRTAARSSLPEVSEGDDRLRHALADDRHEHIFQRRVLPSLLPVPGSGGVPVAVVWPAWLPRDVG